MLILKEPSPKYQTCGPVFHESKSDTTDLKTGTRDFGDVQLWSHSAL